jgi:anti-sigma B factor antagonist
MALRLPVGMRTSGHRTGKEAIPLLKVKTEAAGKPEINIVAEKDGTLVTLCGRIDMDSSPVLRDRLLALLHTLYSKKVNIDLSAVTHIDSSGVATLIEALRTARSHKTELRLQGLQDRLLRLFELTGLLPLFNGSV